MQKDANRDERDLLSERQRVRYAGLGLRGGFPVARLIVTLGTALFVGMHLIPDAAGMAGGAGRSRR